MKFTSQLALFTLALGVFAQHDPPEPPTWVKRSPPSLVGRDLPTVTSVIATVDTNIKDLDTAVQAFSGDVASLNTAAQSLLTSIKDGTTTIEASTSLSLNDALALQQTVTGLQSDAQSLVTSLEAKKSAFEQAGLCEVILSTATDLSTASKALIDAVVAKVPEAAQTVAQQLASGVTATLEQGTKSFASGNCTNAAGSGGGGGGEGGTATETATVTGTVIGGGGGTETCMCPCACASMSMSASASLPPMTNATTSESAPTATANVTTPQTPPVVTAGGSTASYGVPVGLFAAAMAAMML